MATSTRVVDLIVRWQDLRAAGQTVTPEELCAETPELLEEFTRRLHDQAHQQRLNRTVALKMILAGGHAGRDELERFRIEAEAIARLQHPNIVQIFEVGEHGGLPYFALEFCAGGTLAYKLAGTPQPAK